MEVLQVTHLRMRYWERISKICVQICVQSASPMSAISTIYEADESLSRRLYGTHLGAFV